MMNENTQGNKTYMQVQILLKICVCLQHLYKQLQSYFKANMAFCEKIIFWFQFKIYII